MIRRQRLDARYTRILGVGLGISLAVHAAVLAFGHVNVDPPRVADPALRVVTLEDLDVAPEEWERLEAVTKAQFAAAPLPPPLIRLEAPPTPESDPTDESALVLAMATAAALEAPIMPQPRVEPAAIESGLTPLHVLEPIALGVKEESRNSGGGFVISFGGVGCATPGFVNSRYPTRRIAMSRLRFRGRR